MNANSAHRTEAQQMLKGIIEYSYTTAQFCSAVSERRSLRKAVYGSVIKHKRYGKLRNATQ